MTNNGVPADLASRLAEFNALPIMCEDDPEWEMGESNPHAVAEHILRYGLAAHLADQPKLWVFSNMNLHYQPKFPRLYVSPDVMVVAATNPQPEKMRVYRIGRDGPAPLLTAEVLSEETAQQGDLETKVYIYAMVGISEYILVDETGEFLPQRLLIKKLQADLTWKDEHDADGGVTSQLGFRLNWDGDGRLGVFNAASGERYPRPDEAAAAWKAQRRAEERVRELEAELARQREKAAKNKGKSAGKRNKKT